MQYDDIKQTRLKYNISQTKLAENSNFSKATISSWELYKSAPSTDDLKTLSLTLKNIISDICGGKDIRKKRIIHSNRIGSKLPNIIRTPQEYNNLLAKRFLEHENSYRKQLTELYLRANTQKSDDAPKAVALFSGCGGLSLGFAAEGFNLVGHIEIDEAANKIYAYNFPDSDLLGTDICKLTDNQISDWKKQYGNIDILIGGPPCQGFSLAGKRDPNDIRNQLYTYYVHLVSLVKPKAFVMENVRLLTSMKDKNGELFIDHILDDFRKSGYKITIREVNAFNYGVPQSRERVILVGIRNDIGRLFVFPAGDFIDNVQGSLFFEAKRPLTFRDATFDLKSLESGEKSTDPLHWSIVHPEHVIKWLKNVPEGCSAHDNENPDLRPPSGFNTTYKRIRWDEPCSTISTNFSMISGCRNVHPSSTRSLTIREAARAQSFPDEFIFTGNWGDVRRVIGNAVPPLLAEKIAKAVYEQLFKNFKYA